VAGLSPLRVMVTGAQGYLGSKVATCLARKGVTTILTGKRLGGNILVCNLCDHKDVLRAIALIEPDLVVHCAGCVPQTVDEYDDVKSSERNLKMIDHLLDAIACPFVYISSMTVYGDGGRIPKQESEGGNPTSAYGLSKWQGEKLIERANRHALAVRIPGLFGGPRTDGLVSNLVRSSREGKPPRLPNYPLLWAAMHVDDAAESIATLALTNISGFRAINVAYRDVYSISRLVKMVEQIHNCSIIYDIEHPDFEFDLTVADSLQALPSTNLHDALHRI
jgi:nucleoside-diphosphate-sugar epimerase